MAKAKAKNAKKKAVKKTAKKDTIELTAEQFQAAVDDAVKAALAKDRIEKATPKPIPVDISDNVQLETRLKAMNKGQLIKYAGDEFSLKVEEILAEKVIIEQLLKLDKQRKSTALVQNEESLNKTVSIDDPPIKVRFFNLQSPDEVINFFFDGPKGMFGKAFTGPNGEKLGNPNGHKKCPGYTLHPGEIYILALSVVEHLGSLTFTHYKTIIDPLTGHIGGNVPLLKPKYILNPVITKEQLLQLNK